MFIELSAVVEFYFVETTFIFGNKSSCCCSDNPVFGLVCKLPVPIWTISSGLEYVENRVGGWGDLY